MAYDDLGFDDYPEPNKDNYHREQTSGEDFPGEFDEGIDRSTSIVRTVASRLARKMSNNNALNGELD